jgi:DNA-binding MarR family transcriptional regulator
MTKNDWLTDDEDRRALRRLNSVLLQFKMQDAEMPIQQMLVLMWVAMNEGGVQRDLCAALDMPNSTASRNLAALSPIHRLGKPGLGLLTWEESLEDRRAKLLKLTPQGRTFMRQLLTQL